ncbi:MAG: HD domain-containing protein [Planctomycetes bacterium]|nr:HD domain-containing protein [Planctomycetota bacterium]MCC7396640.1 HD domain-containing protein [Planctomycetota bacterium]
MAILRDPVHGDIELTRDELRLVDTNEFQRLRGIKQLGTASFVYPGATHTRFEHSIGTLHVCQQLLDACNKNAARDPAGCHRVADDERRVLRTAALLHDVTHIPYGHNIEDQTGLLPRHDTPARFAAMLGSGELAAELDRQGLRQDVLAILTGDGRRVPPFWRQVVSDTIDADLLDYLRRDAYYTGLELRHDRRVVDYFRIDRESGQLFVDGEKNGMLREDIVSELLRVLDCRYHFSERVYYHHAKVAAGALLSRMVELALRAGALTAAELQRLTDESLVFRLEQLDLGDAVATDRLHRFVARFRRRALLKRVLVLPYYQNQAVQDELLATWFTPGQPEARFAWEAAIEREAQRTFGQAVDVVMYCPKRRMQLKEAKTLVRFPGAGDHTLPLDAFSEQIPRLSDLAQSYPRMWKLYVFASIEDKSMRRRLQEMCLAMLPKGCRNAFVL